MLVEKTQVTYPNNISFIKVAWNRQKPWQNFESLKFFATLGQKLAHKNFYRVSYKLTDFLQFLYNFSMLHMKINRKWRCLTSGNELSIIFKVILLSFM